MEKIKLGRVKFERVGGGRVTPEGAVPIDQLAAADIPEHLRPDGRPRMFDRLLPTAMEGGDFGAIVSEPGEELTGSQGEKLARYRSTAQADRRAALEERAGGPILGPAASAVSGMPLVGGLAPLLSAAADAATSGRSFAQSRREMGEQYAAAREVNPLWNLAPMLAPLGPLTSTPARVAGTFATDALFRSGAQRVMAAPDTTIGGAFTPTPEGLVSVLRDVGVSGATAGLGSAIGTKLIGGAPERVAGRVASDVSRGETSASLRLGKKVASAVGEEGKRLQEVARDIPGLERKLATQARTDPRGTEKAVQQPIADADAVATAQYKVPDELGLSYSVAQVAARLRSLTKKLGETGRMDAAIAVDGISKKYASGEFGERLNASALRNLKGDLGKVAFAKAPGEEITQQVAARRMVYGEVDSMIANLVGRKVARAAGSDPAALAKANRVMSTLIPLRDALAERATKADIGTPALTQTINRATSLASFMENPTLLRAAGMMAMAPPKAATRVAREADYALATIVRMARAGNKPAAIAVKAAELGISPAIAAEIARQATKAVQDEVLED